MIYVLSLDLSLSNTGYVVFGYQTGWKPVIAGLTETKREASKRKTFIIVDNIRRAQDIAAELDKLHKRYSFKALVAEKPEGSQSAVSARCMGTIEGVIATFSEIYQLPLFWFDLRNIKQTMTGTKKADKADMIEAAADLYPEFAKKYFPKGQKKSFAGKAEHIADAIGVMKEAKKHENIRMLARLAKGTLQ